MGCPTRKAIYVNEKIELEVRQQQDDLVPNDGELLIETIYSGVNPADVKHSTLLGIYPAVLGYDFCGKVIKTTTNSKFQLGDIVAGYTPTGIGRPAKYGTHQDYLVCPEGIAFQVPSKLPQHHAACLSVVVMTACDALYNIFKFALPGESPKTEKPRPLLIWGASSSVGISTIQLARASGIYPIFATASPKNHALLQRLGATHCFDYRSPSIATELATALDNGKWGAILNGFDTVGSHGSAEIMATFLSKDARLVSVVLQKDDRFQMPFANTNTDVTIHPKGAPHPITISARVKDHENAWKAFQWAVEHYGKCFELPLIEIFDGSAEEALRKMVEMVETGRGLGKLAIQHPLR